MKNWKLWGFTAVLAIFGIIVGFMACDNGNESHKTFTVTFNSNGGNDVSSQTVNEGEKITEPQNVRKENKILDGWYKESTFSNKWVFVTDTVTTDITLHAKWEPIIPTISDFYGIWGDLETSHYNINENSIKLQLITDRNIQEALFIYESVELKTNTFDDYKDDYPYGFSFRGKCSYTSTDNSFNIAFYDSETGDYLDTRADPNNEGILIFLISNDKNKLKMQMNRGDGPFISNGYATKYTQ
jgi:uncharacterized repeat protein (TIGR02543 family)